MHNSEIRALQSFMKPDNLQQFADMMKETRNCMANRDRTGYPNDTDKCENAKLSILDDYTFHTHPHGKTIPSGLDIATSKRLGKKLMCIGLAPTGEIICYDTLGKRIIERIRV